MSITLTPTHNVALRLTGQDGIVTVIKVADAALSLEMMAAIKGDKGDTGAAGDPAADGALAIINKLAEFDTEQAKADARANLGIAVVDGGTF